MSLRKVTVISTTKSTPKEMYSEATTWDQLKDSLTSDFGDLSKMRAVVKESKATLELGEAELPGGEFTLYLTPKQIKAGGLSVVSILQSLKDKYTEAIDTVIEEINDGEHEGTDTVDAVRTGLTSLASSDAEALRRITAELG